MNRVVALLAALASTAAVAACSSGSARGVGPSPVSSTLPSSPTPAFPSPTPSFPPLALRELAKFSSPVWVGPAPGDPTHLFLAEKTGRVLQLDANGRQQLLVLDLTKQVSRGNEQGLLSIAFDPAYPSNHRLYVDFTDRAGNTKVLAYTVAMGTAGAGQVLLSIVHPFANHNGGLLLFDRTGMLLVGTGDGGSVGDPANQAQDITSDLGKILRIDPRTGAGAVGNPFPQNPRVWALGLRNPWRFSFDANGDFYLGDVGQNHVEELDVVPPRDQSGANYGWSVYEGDKYYKKDQAVTVGALVMPALTYLHDDGGCSITGGEVYHGRALRFLQGSYIFGDFCAGRLWAVDRTPVGVTPLRELGVKIDGLMAFGHDLQGELLVLSAEGLYRLTGA